MGRSYLGEGNQSPRPEIATAPTRPPIWIQRSHILKFYYITQLSYKRMLHFYRASAIKLGITSDSQGDITCDSLGDATWSHGSHDIRDLSERSDGSKAKKLHQGSQTAWSCRVMSTRIFLLPWFRLDRARFWIALSSTQPRFPEILERVREEARWPACRGAPASTSTAALWADFFTW